MAIPLGLIGFDNVVFDAAAVGQALAQFVVQGSIRDAIAITDINIVSRTDPAPPRYESVRDALNGGTRLFDALAYFSLPAQQRPAVRVEELEAGVADPTLEEISQAVFYVFFWTFIRGRSPSIHEDVDVGPVPNFLPATMALTDAPFTYVEQVASFDLARMNPAWIRHVTLTNLGVEAQNRIALGVAGYRVPAAVVFLPWHDNLPPNVLRAARAVRLFVQRGMTWDCYSGTRSPEFLDRVKNFNKNVENLLLDICPGRYLAYARKTKMLAVRPRRRPQYQQYLSWTNETFATFRSYIFGENAVEAVEYEQHHTMHIPEDESSGESSSEEEEEA